MEDFGYAFSPFEGITALNSERQSEGTWLSKEADTNGSIKRRRLLLPQAFSKNTTHTQEGSPGSSNYVSN